MSLLAGFLRTLSEHSSRTCIATQSASHNYGDLLRQCEHWLGDFETMSISPGTVIGLRGDYSLATIPALLALLAHRAIPVLIPRDGSLAGYLEGALASGLLEVGPEGGASYWTVTPPTQSHPLLKRASQEQGAHFIVFTSGSVGPPKASLHSLERFLLKFQKPGRSLRTMAFLLFDHIAGLDTLFYTLRNGGTVVVTLRRDPRAVLDLIETQRVEVLPTSPSFLRLLCAAMTTCSADLSSLKIITYGSEPMDAATLRRVNERFRDVRIIQKYGTTELGSPPTVSRSSDSLWLKFKGDNLETRIVDGVLWIRTQGTMLGYLNVPSPITPDGWYCTGDLVDVDGEWFRFLGRGDEIIKVGGEKVSPNEVERVIREVEFVNDTFVSGEPNALMGQVVTARVAVSLPQVAFSEAASTIRRHCRERLGPHHTPVRVTLVSGDSVTTRSSRQKILRKQPSSATISESQDPPRSRAAHNPLMSCVLFIASVLKRNQRFRGEVPYIARPLYSAPTTRLLS